MNVPAPHFLLFSESNLRHGTEARDDGAWRFVLESVDGEDKLEAVDTEPDVAGERLELLAVVRGLEALDQPSRVTLVTPSTYVSRGLRYGLSEWRDNRWRWERFGRMVPVKNDDLWQRVDQALHYHDVQCRTWRFDAAQDDLPANEGPAADRSQPAAPQRSLVARLTDAGRRWLAGC